MNYHADTDIQQGTTTLMQHCLLFRGGESSPQYNLAQNWLNELKR